MVIEARDMPLSNRGLLLLGVRVGTLDFSGSSFETMAVSDRSYIGTLNVSRTDMVAVPKLAYISKINLLDVRHVPNLIISDAAYPPKGGYFVGDTGLSCPERGNEHVTIRSTARRYRRRKSRRKSSKRARTQHTLL